jgi:succinate-semialdehyde dehydrogenase/glutarate-semialdehyde dehydrogenase
VAGQTVGAIAGKYLKKAIFELGGSDPYLILEDAPLSYAVKKVTQSRLNNCGQVCISAKRVLVHENQISEFVSFCQKEMLKFKSGDPMSESTQLGPLAHFKFKQKYKEQIQELIPYCEVIRLSAEDHSENNFANPAILVFNENHFILNSLEIFGPALIVISYKSEQQAIEIANSTIYGLGCCRIFSGFSKRRSMLQVLWLQAKSLLMI